MDTSNEQDIDSLSEGENEGISGQRANISRPQINPVATQKGN